MKFGAQCGIYKSRLSHTDIPGIVREKYIASGLRVHSHLIRDLLIYTLIFIFLFWKDIETIIM